jgi:hypothetical protein
MLKGKKVLIRIMMRERRLSGIMIDPRLLTNLVR